MSADPRPFVSAPEPSLSIPINFGPNSPSPSPLSGVIGSVLPLRRAEELISTLPGVLSVRIVPGDTGAVGEIHVLTTNEVAPKNMVRNIESALMAQLDLRIDHRKVSIAQSLDPVRASDQPPTVARTPAAPSIMPGGIPGVASPEYVSARETAQAAAAAVAAAQAGQQAAPQDVPPSTPTAWLPPLGSATSGVAESSMSGKRAAAPRASAEPMGGGRRTLIFEDVEVRRSRSLGVLCRVTLSKEGREYIGEADGQESERSRVELAARATVLAIQEAVKATPGGDRSLALEGARVIEAFDRAFVFVSLLARIGRENAVLTGSCEVRESKETSAVLSVLDATNRWMHLDR